MMDNSMINKIQKAKDYATQPDRVTFNALSVEFRGDNNVYTVSLALDGWSCTCPGFQKYGICPHIMSLERLFAPMLKRPHLPYAAGQNIVSDVKKAKRYSEEPDRIRILSFDAQFRGDNNDHHITYDHGHWTSTAAFFQQRGVCSHTMAMERMLKGMVEPVGIRQTE